MLHCERIDGDGGQLVLHHFTAHVHPQVAQMAVLEDLDTETAEKLLDQFDAAGIDDQQQQRGELIEPVDEQTVEPAAEGRQLINTPFKARVADGETEPGALYHCQLADGQRHRLQIDSVIADYDQNGCHCLVTGTVLPD